MPASPTRPTRAASASPAPPPSRDAREPDRPGRAVERPLLLDRVIRRAREAAWKGRSIDRFFRGALEFAAAGESSLVFFHGEYVGEVTVDPAAREQALPRGFIRVYQEFNPKHRFHYVSDPRRLAPGFEQDRGHFPSRECAALALLEALDAEGKLRRFEGSLDPETSGPLARVTFASASRAAPWFRVLFRERELGWVMIERKRGVKEGRWLYMGPPALGPHRRVGFFQTRDDATLAMIDAVRRRFAEAPERFASRIGIDVADASSWNAVAAGLVRALDADGEGARGENGAPPDAGADGGARPRRWSAYPLLSEQPAS